MSLIFLPCVAGPLAVRTTPSVTWNPSDKGSGVTLSGGNLVATGGSSTLTNVRATTGRASSGGGKHYFEVVMTTINSGSDMPIIGIGTAALLFDNSLGSGSAGTFATIQSTPAFCYSNGGYKASGVTFANGDRLNVAVDLTGNKIWFGKNGTYILSGNPGAGTGATWNLTASTTYYPIARVAATGPAPVVTAHFASLSWVDAAPSGFVAW